LVIGNKAKNQISFLFVKRIHFHAYLAVNFGSAGCYFLGKTLKIRAQRQHEIAARAGNAGTVGAIALVCNIFNSCTYS
jgi:hypothetical protein